ncbi:MAG: TlpA family protein disulfide reductase [Gammaproteobacteria bacterium]|nr:TlpA family protein disulfide reductase [Gammaproteobacteria bacterium]
MINKKQLNSFFLCSILFFISGKSVAVDFSFIDTKGTTHQLSQYQGQWVVVNFWATWCPPCRKEIPDLSDFHEENNNAVVIGINYEPKIKEDALNKFIGLYLINYPITRVNKDIITALGEPRGLPTSMLIDPEGNIVKKITGMVDGRQLKALMK